jgi:hypothetical protein
LKAAACEGRVVIYPIRFVSSRSFKEEMGGPTGLVRTFFGELKGK